MVVDKVLDTCTAGGVEILGLHATVAPRRQQQQTPPTLEKFDFVPYMQPESSSKSSSLARYTETTLGLIKKSLDHLLQDGINGTLSNLELFQQITAHLPSEFSEQDVARYEASPNCGLIQTLNQLFQLEHNDTFNENVSNILEMNKQELEHDRLLSHLKVDDICKVLGDLVLENGGGRRLKIVEVGAAKGGMYNHVVPNLIGQPMVNVDYTAVDSSLDDLDQDALEEMEIKASSWDLVTDVPSNLASADLVIAANCLHMQDDLSKPVSNLTELMKDNGFLMLLETTHNLALPFSLKGLHKDLSHFTGRTLGPFCDESAWEQILAEHKLEIIAKKSDGHLSTIYLCRKVASTEPEAEIICVNDGTFSWVDQIKDSLSKIQDKPANHTVWLMANSPCNGVIGMANCLRQETGGDHLRCVFTDSSETATEISTSSPLFQALLKKDLVMNVHRRGQWGSCRHIPTKSGSLVDTTHAYVNVLTRGDLASLRWIESPLKHFSPEDHPTKELCSVAYTSLNFRDIMLATGKLPPDAIPGDMASQDCILGMEFSGYDSKNKRVMGLLPAKGLATTVDADSRFLWDVPESWSLQDAASVPVVYATVYYALVVRGQIKKGDKVLIHSGSGGVGQAAIAVALHHGCEVFTTVGSSTKRQYLMERFPSLQERNFSNSRDTTFEWDILRATRGKGVDVVLNSLAEEKLQASLRVLAPHGRFLEIGKFDLANNTGLGEFLLMQQFLIIHIGWLDNI